MNSTEERNPSLDISRHGSDELVRVWGACARLRRDASDAGLASAIEAYGWPTVRAAICYQEYVLREKELRECARAARPLLEQHWLTWRLHQIFSYLPRRIPRLRPRFPPSALKSAIRQLKGDPSNYGVGLARRIHGNQMIDEIMLMRLSSLQMEATAKSLDLIVPVRGIAPHSGA